MDFETLIDDIASQADDFLADASNRTEARTAIAEFLQADHPKLSPSDRRKVIEGVLAILEKESFFNAQHGSGWSEPTDDEPA